MKTTVGPSRRDPPLRREALPLHPVGNEVHPLGRGGADGRERVANRLAHGDDVVGPPGQGPVEPWGDCPDQAARQGKPIGGQLAGQQGMGIVDDRNSAESVRRHQQALIVVGVDHVEADLLMQAAKQSHQHRVQQEELADGGSGTGATIEGDIPDPMDDEGRVGELLAQMVGHDVHRMSPARHGLGDAVNPDGSAARPRKRAGRDDGDTKRSAHRSRPPAARQLSPATRSRPRRAARSSAE